MCHVVESGEVEMLVSMAPDDTHMTRTFVELFPAWWQHGDVVFDFGSSCCYLKREQESWKQQKRSLWFIVDTSTRRSKTVAFNLSLHDGSCQGYRSIVGVQGGSREDAQGRYRASLSLFHTLHQDTVCLGGLVWSIRVSCCCVWECVRFRGLHMWVNT